MYKSVLVTLALVFLGACGDSPRSGSAPAPTAAPIISSLSPSGTTEATKFNVQPDGSSAFSVNGRNFDPKAVIFANDQKLTTAFGNPEWITATMPPDLYAKPGSIKVKVVGGGGQESNVAEFVVSQKN